MSSNFCFFWPVGSPPSTVASPPSVCSIPQSPMSILSEASSIQPVTDSQSFGQCPNQASTSTNEQSQARQSSEVDMTTPVPLLLFKSTNEVESAGVQRNAAVVQGYPLNGIPATISEGGDVKGQMSVDPSERSTPGRQTDVVCMHFDQLVNSRPLITKKESTELRALVESDPNLKTCRNRFENQPGIHQKVVQLPPYIPPSTRPDPRHIEGAVEQPITTLNEPSRPPSYDVHLQRQRTNERLAPQPLQGVVNSTPTPVIFTSGIPNSISSTNSGIVLQSHTSSNLFTSVQPSLPANFPPPPQFPPPPPYTLASNAVIASTVFKFNATPNTTFQSEALTNHSNMKQQSATPTSMKQTVNFMHPTAVSIPASTAVFASQPLFRPLVVEPSTNQTVMSAAPTDKNENQLFRPIPQSLNTAIPANMQHTQAQLTTHPTQQLTTQTQLSFTGNDANQVRTAPPSGNEFSIHDLDIELDFDAEMFDSALADITLDNSLQGN